DLSVDGENLVDRLTIDGRVSRYAGERCRAHRSRHCLSPPLNFDAKKHISGVKSKSVVRPSALRQARLQPGDRVAATSADGLPPASAKAVFVRSVFRRCAIRPPQKSSRAPQSPKKSFVHKPYVAQDFRQSTSGRLWRRVDRADHGRWRSEFAQP